MKSYKLKNGLKIIHIPKKGKGVFVCASVKIGSNHEDSEIRGVSHFVEHMLFEGTKTRSTKDIAKEIEDVGGEMNAATSNERTLYYVYILKKHFEKALDVLSDIIKNPKLDEKSFVKERKIVIDELKMSKDDPKAYQWDLFLGKIFKKHPAKVPIIGRIGTVENISREKLERFYRKYYVPENMTLIIVGDKDNVLKRASRYFEDFSGRATNVKREFYEPEETSKTKFIEKQDIKDSYLVLGYKACNRRHKDSYVLDVIRAILARGQSSRLFEEFRIKRGIGYIVNAVYDANYDYGFFAVNVSTNKQNLKLSEKLIIDCMKLGGLTEKELQEAKDFIEGNFLLRYEDFREIGDWISYWDLIDIKKHDKYLNEIKKINLADVKRATKKYFTGKYTMVVLKQED